MANRGRRAGRTSLGMLSGRLCGGFSASPLPGSSPSSSSSFTSDSSVMVTESAGTNSRPQSPFYSLGSGNQREGSPPSSVGSNSELSYVLASMTTTLQTVLETTRKMERTITNIEEKQVQLAENVKELNMLLKRQERENFSIKGSTWEVRQNIVLSNVSIKTTHLGTPERRSS